MRPNAEKGNHMAKRIEWFMVDGQIARLGKKRLIYPDPMSENFLEAHYGVLNMMLLNGAGQEEIERADREFWERLHGPAKVEPMPKKFSPEDEFRARGMGIDLSGF